MEASLQPRSVEKSSDGFAARRLEASGRNENTAYDSDSRSAVTFLFVPPFICMSV